MTAAAKDLGRIGVVMGGESSEREISLKSGRAVVEALREAGCRADPVELTDHDPARIQAALNAVSADIAFVAMHGAFGEDGGLQRVLEGLGVTYTGSGVRASQLAMNKALTQNFLKEHQIPVADFWVLVKDAGMDPGCFCRNNWPVVVKPATEGSSIGIRIVENEDQLRDALDEAFRLGPTVLLERFIPGRELTAGILEGETLPLVEIKPRKGYFDFQAKYQKGLTDYHVPADLPPELTRRVQDLAEQTFRLIGCRDFGRVDVMIDRQDRPFVLEINTVPGFTATSLLPMAAAAAGISFPELCCRIVERAVSQRPQTSA